MANPPSTASPSNRLHISSLLSPPELKPTDSFGPSMPPALWSESFAHTSFNGTPKSTMAAFSKRDEAYASPPISPEGLLVGKKNMAHAEEEHGVLDPPLFASGDAPVADMPLFPQDSMEPLARHTITAHMQSHDYANLEEKPSRADYELAISFQSNVFKSAAKDPRKWWKQERAFDQYYGRPTGVSKGKQPALKKLAPAPSIPARKNKVAIPRVSQSAPQRTPRVAQKAKRSPLSQTLDSFDSSPMSESSPRPARQATTRDDTDYLGLCDYSPPIDTLPNNSKCLKAEWKGSVLDLSNDPDRHRLHEAELVLASTLRLTCATYLCSKRRLFIGRVEALKKGKEFRKTDAQQACKIDVNKASKLWSSYDKVGWFNPDYFRQFL
ncbi:hypothetical protein NX059_001735 [Plenodomus lindquistii]|nr:hypothetical protein NX059_001735 [Plenodomus lindquistii]